MMKAEHADAAIRVALKAADSRGKLAVMASGVGIAGGEAELRKIMTGTEPLHLIDRGMLGMHLGLGMLV